MDGVPHVRSSNLLDGQASIEVVTPNTSWLGRFLAFIPGAIVGAIFGFRAVVTVNEPEMFFGVWAGASIVGGLLSASLGVRFWEALASLRWFQP